MRESCRIGDRVRLLVSISRNGLSADPSRAAEFVIVVAVALTSEIGPLSRSISEVIAGTETLNAIFLDAWSRQTSFWYAI